MKSYEQRLRDAEIQLEKHRVRPRGGTGRPYATKTVAAADSSATNAANADFFCTGTDDQIKIMEAIVAASPGNVKLLDGEYIVSAPIEVGFIDTVIEGSGTYGAVIRPQEDITAAFDIFTVGNSFTQLYNFAIVSDYYGFEAGDGHGIRMLYDSGYLLLDKMRVSAWTSALLSNDHSYMLLRDSDLYGEYGAAVRGGFWQRSVVLNCDIASGESYGIYLDGMQRCIIAGNRFNQPGLDAIKVGA